MWPPCWRCAKMGDMSSLDWSSATFAGARHAGARAVADADPQQRLAWLDEALALALASGALARVRRERQEAVDASWLPAA